MSRASRGTCMSFDRESLRYALSACQRWWRRNWRTLGTAVILCPGKMQICILITQQEGADSTGSPRPPASVRVRGGFVLVTGIVAGYSPVVAMW
jgi:hypothetical protein